MHHLEKEYSKEFSILIDNGMLIDEWANVYDHCKTEAILAEKLSGLLGLHEDDKRDLIKAAILHDWYKRKEREAVNLNGIKAFYETEEDSKNGLRKLSVSERVIEIAHSVGSNDLDNVKNYDFIRKLMHYIDDSCNGSDIVGLEHRIDQLEKSNRYKDHNEEGKKIYGITLFQKQRETGRLVATEILDKLIQKL